MHPIFVQLGWNLDGDWPIRKQNPYQHQFLNVNNNNYTCCAKIAGKEETPKCRKKTVTWTNGMIEDLIDFIEIHPIVAFEAIYEPMLTLFWSLISLLRSTLVHNNAIQRAAPSSPPKNVILFVVSPAKTCVYSSQFLASCIHKLEFKFS